VTVLGATRDALVSGALVVADAARLLVRHLPALLTVFLLGLAARNAVLWVAVLVGRDHGVIASFLLPLAPLAMVVSLVLMLRIAGGAIVAKGSTSSQVALLTSVLIPFLTVYAVTGRLADDQAQFVNESYADERYQGHGGETPLAVRTIAATEGNLLLYLLVGFLVVRFAIDILDLEERHTGWGLVQVLVEVTWLTLFATFLTNQLGDLRDWVQDLVVLTWVTDSWRSVTDTLGPLTDPARAVSGLFSDTLEHIGPIVVVPLLWLAVGAVVLVGGLPQSRRETPALPTSSRRVTARLAPRLERLRSRRAGAKLLELAGRRFEDLVDGIRVIVHAGLLPVLVFCLVLPLARLAQWGTAEAIRLAVGPRDPETMILFSRYPDIVLDAVYTLTVVVIVVAAVDRLLLRREPQVDAEVAPETEPVKAG
jgi:hypothetical protein